MHRRKAGAPENPLNGGLFGAHLLSTQATIPHFTLILELIL